MANYYVATPANGGSDSANGAIGTPWATWQKGFNTITSSDILYIRGGTYTPTATNGSGDNPGTTYCGVYISAKHGTSTNKFTVQNYPGEVPIMDGGNLTNTGGRSGILLNSCNYWYIKGLTVRYVAQHSSGSYFSHGFELAGGNNNLIENCVSHHNGGPGYKTRLPDGHDNHLVNCDAYSNYDPYSGDIGGDADGFDIGFGYGDYRQRLTGCRAWDNSDDGFDMYQYPGNESIYILTSCWSWNNGYRSDGVTTGGDGCGFKYGADDLASYTITRRFTYNCIAYDNRARGFSQESGQVKMEFYNNTAYKNHAQGFSFWGFNIAGVLRNNIAWDNNWDEVEDIGTARTHDHNTFDSAVTVSDADFVSITSQLANARQSDGSLPVMTFLHLAASSDLKIAGTPISGLTTDCDGVTYNVTEPSMGAFQYVTPGNSSISGTANGSSSVTGAVRARGKIKGVINTYSTVTGICSDAGKISLVINGEPTTSSITGDWSGRNIDRSEPTNLIYSNNTITSVNTEGYQLQAGDDAVEATGDHMLDDELIIGNKLIYNGAHAINSSNQSIMHGIFTGYQSNAVIKYNNIFQTPMAIIRKANGFMDTGGGVCYNIVKNPFAVGVVCKGMGGVRIYNNTFYSNQPGYSDAYSGTWRGIVDIYENPEDGGFSPGCKIKNNIFYTVNQIYNISIYQPEDLVDFESDYNIFYCEGGTPMFYHPTLGARTFSQWQAAGYDTNSIVIDPDFNNTTDFIPSVRLDYGTNLGSEWIAGLATSAVWTLGSAPATENQNGTWQVGARIFNNINSIPVSGITVSGTGSATTIITAGGTLQMVTDVLPVDADNKSVTWSRTNGSGSASINASGLLTAVTDGTVTVRATANDGSAVFDELVITISNQTSAPVYKNIAPTGWHIPTDAELITLVTSLGADPGGHLKESGTVHWLSPNTGADNTSLFTLLPTGYREDVGGFFLQNSFGFVAAITEVDAIDAYYLSVNYNSAIASIVSGSKNSGLPVRCIKDDANNPGIMTDYDGNEYPTVKIGDQVWMGTNLRVTHYTDGTPIALVTDNTAWAGLSSAGMSFYSNVATSSGGIFYSGTEEPTNIARLNYDGYFYATKVFAGGVELGAALANPLSDWFEIRNEGLSNEYLQLKKYMIGDFDIQAWGNGGIFPAGVIGGIALGDGATRFLREDGTWQAISITGGGTTDHALLSSLTFAASGHTGFQATLSGTGFVKSAGGSISYDANVVVDGDFGSQGIMVRGSSSGSYSIISNNSAVWNLAQAGHANLSSLSGLIYSSVSFVKLTAANTFVLDTNIYLTTTVAANTYAPISNPTFTGTAIIPILKVDHINENTLNHGIVMGSKVGIGTGTSAPLHELDVRGTLVCSGDIIAYHS